MLTTDHPLHVHLPRRQVAAEETQPSALAERSPDPSVPLSQQGAFVFLPGLPAITITKGEGTPPPPAAAPRSPNLSTSLQSPSPDPTCRSGSAAPSARTVVQVLCRANSSVMTRLAAGVSPGVMSYLAGENRTESACNFIIRVSNN